MKRNLRDLYDNTETILQESGFPPELYIIKMHDDCVSVHFDSKEAVDYFKGDFDVSEIGSECIFEYKQIGKRHAAYIYNW